MKSYLERKTADKTLTVMDWPPLSPDLNIIEAVWDHLDRKINKVQPKEELWEVLKEALYNIVMVLAYLRFCPIRFLISLSDFSCAPRQSFALLCQLLVSPGILPGRIISASFPPLGANLSFQVYTSTELAHC